MKEIFRPFIVIFHHVSAIVIHSIRTSTFVEYHFNRSTIESILFYRNIKIFIIDIICKIQHFNIASFTAIRQIINNQNVIATFIIQLFYNIGADKPSTTCNNNHNFPSFTNPWIRSMIPVVEYPSWNGKICTSSTNSLPMTSSGL